MLLLYLTTPKIEQDLPKNKWKNQKNVNAHQLFDKIPKIEIARTQGFCRGLAISYVPIEAPHKKL